MGAVGVTGTGAANALAQEADVVLAVGTRLQDFTTGSWALFKNARSDASSASTSRPSMPASTPRLPLVADARVGLEELSRSARRLDGARRAGRRSAQERKTALVRERRALHATPPMRNCPPMRR